MNELPETYKTPPVYHVGFYLGTWAFLGTLYPGMWPRGLEFVLLGIWTIYAFATKAYWIFPFILLYLMFWLIGMVILIV